MDSPHSTEAMRICPSSMHGVFRLHGTCVRGGGFSVVTGTSTRYSTQGIGTNVETEEPRVARYTMSFPERISVGDKTWPCLDFTKANSLTFRLNEACCEAHMVDLIALSTLEETVHYDQWARRWVKTKVEAGNYSKVYATA
ncbi:hypothetical protein FOA52_010380 [Chlamydomonas sp. UWO 241]|nr:hypothetical protein FOA52_010380 [Chlamydomonas sp. UWO 241]